MALSTLRLEREAQNQVKKTHANKHYTINRINGSSGGDGGGERIKEIERRRRSRKPHEENFNVVNGETEIEH